MKTYKEHFLEAREFWSKENPGKQAPSFEELYNFDVFSISSETLNQKGLVVLNKHYMSAVDTVADALNKRYESREDCWFPPNLDEANDFAIRIKNIWNINGLEELCESILPQIEEKLFGSYAYLEAIYAYKNIYRAAPPRASWLWHFDNHPKETIKIMIYLTDVDDTSGTFEVLTNEAGMVLKEQTQRVNHTKWLSIGSRVPDKAIREFCSAGWNRTKILGPKGSLCIFDNNIIHRASIPAKGKERSAVVFMLRPTNIKMRPYISEDHTGTNYHIDVWKDPSHIGVERRC